MSLMVQSSFTLEGVLFEGAYTEEIVLATKNFQGRPDDIHLSTYPRTGTTWTQNILVGMVYGLDELQKTGQVNMRFIFPYMEIHFPDQGPGIEIAKTITRSPRMLKNHLPSHLAPREIFTQKRRNIVVVRNPKDTALSYFKFYQTEPTLASFRKTEVLEEFLPMFLEGNVFYGSWWEWTKGWVKACRENPENNLMIHYEQLHESFEETIDQLASFLGLQQLNAENKAALKSMTNIDSMKQRYEKDSEEKDMIRKGKMNGWVSKFTPEMAAKYDEKTRQVFEDEEIYKKFI